MVGNTGEHGAGGGVKMGNGNGHESYPLPNMSNGGGGYGGGGPYGRNTGSVDGAYPMNGQMMHRGGQENMLQSQRANSINGGGNNGMVNGNGNGSGVNEKPNFIALFDYEQATTDDMTIKKNDPLIVMNKSHPDWWLAKNLRSQQTGYVPYNYITSIDDLQIKEWFFPSTSRREAERLLEYLDNEPGVYLIRESEQDQGKCWSLSILDYNDDKQRHTKHYRIRKIDDGGCYISTRNRFASLDELVMFYSRKLEPWLASGWSY